MMKILYDKAGAAEQLSISERMVDDLRKSGELRSKKLGREYKFRHEDLAAYAESLDEYEPEAS